MLIMSKDDWVLATLLVYLRNKTGKDPKDEKVDALCNQRENL